MSPFFKKLLIGTLSLLGLCILWMLFILLFAYGYYLAGYYSVEPAVKHTLHAQIEAGDVIVTDTGSVRRTGNTFMSIPEWYIVSISDDYTTWLEKGNNPSDFPYWGYLKDYWIMYGKITAYMDDIIPRDYEYHTMVRVIGISTTFELGLKSLYESSIGRLTSLVAYSSVADTFYAQSSRRYVDFILLKPWYEFSYDQELTLLNNVKNKRKNTVELVREIERHMFYAPELSIKHAYAQAIEKATRAEFAAPDPYTTVIGDFSGVVLSDLTGGVLWENNSTLKIPRYFPFTQIYPKIAKKHPRIQKIAGNQNIVMEFQTADRLNMPGEILRMPIRISPEKNRVFVCTQHTTHATLFEQYREQLVHIYDF